jgi:glycosyltransferase A (GT-A) superfamily protein (DUF2064 family)
MIKGELLIIASKFPAVGEVKTRLAQSVEPEQAAAVGRAILEDLAENHRGQPSYRLVIETDKKERVEDFKTMIKGVEVHAGMGKDLRGVDSKTYEIFKLYLSGNDKVIMISSDTPMIDTELIVNAFRLMDSVDVVLGPDGGGGYYLIGMSKPYDFFTSLSGGRGPYFDGTLKLAEKAGLRCGLTETLTDIDYVDDIKRLDLDRLEGGWPRTAKICRHLKARWHQGNEYIFSAYKKN